MFKFAVDLKNANKYPFHQPTPRMKIQWQTQSVWVSAQVSLETLLHSTTTDLYVPKQSISEPPEVLLHTDRAVALLPVRFDCLPRDCSAIALLGSNKQYARGTTGRDKQRREQGKREKGNEGAESKKIGFCQMATTISYAQINIDCKSWLSVPLIVCIYWQYTSVFRVTPWIWRS